MKIINTILYLLEWLIPSSTAVYIVASPQFTWGTYYFWGYPLNMPAYIIACFVGAIIYYPLNKYVFKTKCKPVKIKINGETFNVNPDDEFEAYDNSWGDIDISRRTK